MIIDCICNPTYGQSCTTCDGTKAEQDWADDDLTYEDDAA